MLKLHRWKNEGKLNSHIIKQLEKVGRAIKLAGGYFQENGLPDILFVSSRSSIACFIESKIHPRNCTALQQMFLETQSKRGIKCYKLTYFGEIDTYEVYDYVRGINHLIIDGSLPIGDLYSCLI